MEYIEPDYELMREVMNERGKRPAKIRYIARTDAALRAENRPGLPTPLKSLISDSAAQDSSNIPSAPRQKGRLNPHAGSVSPVPKKIAPQATTQDYTKICLDKGHGPAQQTTQGPSAENVTKAEVNGARSTRLPLSRTDPEDLATTLDHVVQWLREVGAIERTPAHSPPKDLADGCCIHAQLALVQQAGTPARDNLGGLSSHA